VSLALLLGALASVPAPTAMAVSLAGYMMSALWGIPDAFLWLLHRRLRSRPATRTRFRNFPATSSYSTSCITWALADQRGVLRAVAGRIPPGGRVLIRTTFRDRSWRYFATLAEEAVVRMSGWIRGGRCRFPSRAEVVAGLEVSIRPMGGKTPFNSYLIEAKRAADA